MKIYCEKCQGKGNIMVDVVIGCTTGDFESKRPELCPNCGGKRYTENTQIEIDAELGKMFRWAINNGVQFVITDCYSDMTHISWEDEEILRNLWEGVVK